MVAEIWQIIPQGLNVLFRFFLSFFYLWNFELFCQSGGGEFTWESELESGEEESESEELSMSGIASFILLDPRKCKKIKILAMLFQFSGKSIVFVSFLLFGRWRKFLIATCPTP